MQDLKDNICLKIKLFIGKFEKYFCFTKQELEEINESVKTTYKNSNNYERVEASLPQLLKAIKELENENISLKNNVDILKFNEKYLLDMVGKIYFADVLNDEKEKEKLFSELGFRLDKKIN